MRMSHTGKKRKTGYRRLRLQRRDGQIYLDRWGFLWEKVGGIFLHKMTAPDPGPDLHDHPWTFVTVPLLGSYIEVRADTREAVLLARTHRRSIDPTWIPVRGERGLVRNRRPRLMRLDECHMIVRLNRKTVWTMIFVGPRRRDWGFYTADGFQTDAEYTGTRKDYMQETVDK